MKVLLCAAMMSLCLAGQALAQVRITEWAYSGIEGEFIEFTNLGPGVVDLTGWSFDDDSRTAGTVELSSLGSIAAGESFLISELDEATFRDAWNLSASVKIFGSNTTNLGRNDEINIFDDLDNLVDRFAYGDQNFPGTIRTQNVSGNPVALSDLETDNVGTSSWVVASTGDSYGSYLSDNGDVGNPGIFSLYTAVPEPTSLALAGLCMIGLAIRRR